MPSHSLLPSRRAALSGLLALAACASQCFPQARGESKVFGGYFEEWGIGYAHYNIADLEKNGVANELTHLIYAFGNVTPTSSPACAIAEPASTAIRSAPSRNLPARRNSEVPTNRE